MIRGPSLSIAWLSVKILFYLVVSMQAADIVVVAYQQF
jgi:hypothetical protein